LRTDIDVLAEFIRRLFDFLLQKIPVRFAPPNYCWRPLVTSRRIDASGSIQYQTNVFIRNLWFYASRTANASESSHYQVDQGGVILTYLLASMCVTERVWLDYIDLPANSAAALAVPI
jgi:hypothetical protein